MKKDNIIMRFSRSIHLSMLEDLRRPHPFVHERVGFLYTKSKRLSDDSILILGTEYIPVDDDDYIDDKSVGAKIRASAIRKPMQSILNKKSGCFHVHLHDHHGRPIPSLTDNKSLPGVIESFSNISINQSNGILILSSESFYTSIKVESKKIFQSANLISVIGVPCRFHHLNRKKIRGNKIFDRQSFLGYNSETLFKNIRVGIIGYGGGGSHIGQQLAHIGIVNPIIFDNDKMEDTNLNRLIGACFNDIKKAVFKTKIAKRVFKRILPYAKVICVNDRWQNFPEVLQSCDFLFGCADTYAERQQLEAECRRYLIPYIDIGRDVHQAGEQAPSMSGQVILSMPGEACMWCYGFLTEKKIGLETAKYGKVGGRPQVVWPNGVLASTAVGIMVEIITGWTKRSSNNIYLEYDGNRGTIGDHIRLQFCKKNCNHYPTDKIGPVSFKKI